MNFDNLDFDHFDHPLIFDSPNLHNYDFDLDLVGVNPLNFNPKLVVPNVEMASNVVTHLLLY